MPSPCPRCHTYCYGDCTASEGRGAFSPRANARPAKRVVHESKIVIDGVVKTREAWEQRIAEDTARLATITNEYAIEGTIKRIEQIRAKLAQ